MEAAVVFLEHHVEVGAAEPEGADTGAPGMFAGHADPRPGLGVQVKGRVLLQRRVGLLDVDRRREDAVLQRQGGLDQSGHARAGLGVADHRLDRSDGASRRLLFPAAVDVDQALDLGAIADGRAGRVRLDQRHAGRFHRGILVGPAQRQRLRFGEGGGQALVPAVAGTAHAANHRIDRIPVPFGVR